MNKNVKQLLTARMLSSCCRVISQDDLQTIVQLDALWVRPSLYSSKYRTPAKTSVLVRRSSKMRLMFKRPGKVVHLTFLLNYLQKDSKSQQNRVRLYPQSIRNSPLTDPTLSMQIEVKAKVGHTTRTYKFHGCFCCHLIERRGVTTRYHGNKMSISQTFFLTETTICVVLVCIHGQESHTCHFFSATVYLQDHGLLRFRNFCFHGNAT